MTLVVLTIPSTTLTGTLEVTRTKLEILVSGLEEGTNQEEGSTKQTKLSPQLEVCSEVDARWSLTLTGSITQRSLVRKSLIHPSLETPTETGRNRSTPVRVVIEGSTRR